MHQRRHAESDQDRSSKDPCWPHAALRPRSDKYPFGIAIEGILKRHVGNERR